MAVDERADRLIAIGASTGGTEVIRDLLQQLPQVLGKQKLPAVVITQHIAPSFVEALAQSLDKAGTFNVTVAKGGERITSGNVCLAPGDKHLLVSSDDQGFFCRLDDSQASHKPSVDVMFDSVAATAGNQAIGVLLTGMGKDGAEGLLKMRERGAYTIAQDEKSSVVWGMPGEAVRINAVDAVVGIESMATQIAAKLTVQI